MQRKSRRSGLLLAILIVLAYVGFEGFAIHKASHRTKPGFIHTMMVQARTAVERCDPTDANSGVRGAFNRTLERVEGKLRQSLAEEQPEKTPDEIEQQIARRVQDAQASIGELLNGDNARDGCDTPALRKHLKRYHIYASKGR